MTDEPTLCPCAECGRRVLPFAWRHRFWGLGSAKRLKGAILGHQDGRPFCDRCLEATPLPRRATQADARRGGDAGPLEDGSPWQQNAYRDWEDSEMQEPCP